MRKFLRKLVLWVLTVMAKRRLKRFKGKIIAVTGSVGKTSTKEAIFTVLNSKFRVKKSKGNMNSDFGLPLTILGIESGNRSAAKWSWLLLKAFWHMLHDISAEVLLLELGVDGPGDMDFLTSIVKPDIAVITNISGCHIDEGQFKNVEEVFHEKVKLLEALKEEGKAVLNIDDERLAKLIGRLGKKRVLSFGRNEEANYFSNRVSTSVEGIAFVAHKRGSEETCSVRASVLGDHQLYVLLPALICADLLGMSFEEISLALERYRLPPGRLSLIPGIEDTVILDASYNASPLSMLASLKTLNDVAEGRRRVAVLGSMNELGEKSEELHAEVGESVPSYADILITVGKAAGNLAESARKKGMATVFEFKNAGDAAEFFKGELKKGDLILVKGSQNKIRLERFVKEFMLEPERAKELLVRQSKVWNL